MNKVIHAARSLAGTVEIPGDKSISHRSLMFGALAEGQTEVKNLLQSEDVFSTISCLRQLGCEITQTGSTYLVQGAGFRGLKAPTATLDCGNSGTTMRLLLGILAGQDFSCELSGDESLCKRPMRRVTEPLSQMGARYELTNDNFPPVKVIGTSSLKPLSYELPVASAQVKSALLLAGLFAIGETILTGKIQSRDHTERMLASMGVSISETANQLALRGGQVLSAKKITVPSDPSTASFWIAAACIVPDSKIELHGILLNPSRTGFFKVLERMGAKIRTEITDNSLEPVGRVTATTSSLKGTEVFPDEISSLIDEIPLLAIVACCAQGQTKVSGASELRVKESDRISAIVQNLQELGIEVEETADGFIIEGPQTFGPGLVKTYHDHRIAMAFSIAGLVAKGDVEIQNSEVVAVSYPHFYEHLEKLINASQS